MVSVSFAATQALQGGILKEKIPSSTESCANSATYTAKTSDTERTPAWKSFFRPLLIKQTQTQEVPNKINVQNILGGSVHGFSADDNNDDDAKTPMATSTKQLNFQANKLYGREEEIKLVRNLCFSVTHGSNNNNSSSNNQVLLITGPSGMGKSTLAFTLQEPAETTLGGFFVRGKYDFGTQAQAYAAIADACRELCDKIIVPHNSIKGGAQESALDSMIIKRQDELRLALDTSIHALAPLIPSILKATGTSQDEHEYAMAVGDVSNRFQYAMVQFLKTVTKWGKVVMLIDDLQWADSESLALLQVLVKDVPGFVLTGCYRSNEVDDTHIFAKWMRDVDKDSPATLHKVQVKPMDSNILAEMLSDLLSVHKDERVLELANVVLQKTMGNPFFTKEFLKIVQEAGALFYNSETQAWVWDINDISKNAAATPNVIEMMVQKISKLPQHIVQVLPVAACLGTTFRAQSLETVTNVLWEAHDVDEEDTKQDTDRPEVPSLWNRDEWLASCVEKGILREGSHGDEYKWEHDKFREASLAMIDQDKLPSFRFQIGQVMMGHLYDEELARSIFTVADLLNAGRERKIRNSKTCLKIADINRQAAQAAMASACFQQAVAYLEAGFGRLPKNAWKDHSELALEMHSSAAEAYFCIGNSDKVEAHCKAVIDQEDLSLPDKFRAYNCLMDSYGNRNLLDRAIQLCVLLLDELGCRLPKKNFLFHTIAGIGRIKMTARKYSDVKQFKTMTDVSEKQCMRALDKLITYTYIRNSPLLPLSIIKSLKWSVDRGLSEFSPPNFATVGLLLCSQLHVNNLPIFSQVEGRTLMVAWSFVVSHYTNWKECSQRLVRGYQAGLASGDIESASYAIVNATALDVMTGKKLEIVEHDARVHVQQFRELELDSAATFLEPAMVCAQNLLGMNQNGYVYLEGEEKVAEYRQLGSLAEGYVREAQMHLATFFGKDEYGADIALDVAENGVRQCESSQNERLFSFEMALACYTAARKTGRKRYLKPARKHHGLIKVWTKAGNFCLNFALHLLNAEEAMNHGKTDKAFAEYALAIKNAQEVGFRNYNALVHERCGNASAELGDVKSARHLWRQALALYEEWGAKAVVRKLKKKIKASRRDSA